jgi:hypothetical protein
VCAGAHARSLNRASLPAAYRSLARTANKYDLRTDVAATGRPISASFVGVCAGGQSRARRVFRSAQAMPPSLLLAPRANDQPERQPGWERGVNGGGQPELGAGSPIGPFRHWEVDRILASVAPEHRASRAVLANVE